DPETVRAQLAEHGLDILVDVEVLRVLPRPLDVVGDRAGSGRVAAHSDDDSLRELDPELLVVPKVGVLLDLLDRRGTSLVVQCDVQLDAVPPADPEVSLRTEFRPGTGEREIDVEENGFQIVAGHLYASGRREASDGRFRRTCSTIPRSRSAMITPSSSGAR